MKKLVVIFTITILILGCGGSSDTNNPSEISKATLIKNSTTADDGVAMFTDSSSEESVFVYVNDKDDNPLSEINVEFWDAENYEFFIFEDPSGKYLPAFEIYSHNSNHWITLYLPEDENDNEIKELPFSSDKGQAMENLLLDTTEKRIYHGRFTPEEINKADEIRLIILKATGLGSFFTFISQFQDFVEKTSKIFNFEYQEPEFYDVYTLLPSGITTTLRWMEPVENTPCTDTDGDGYSIEGGICGEIDCDDNNYYINPGTTEGCEDEIIELKNDDGSPDYSYGWQGTCIGSSPIGNVPDGSFGFSTYLTPLSYPFYISAVSINFAKADSSGAGFYLHVINEDGVELLPVPMLIPHSEFTGYGWWKKDLSEFNLKIDKGSIRISIFESYMAPLNCSTFEFQINGWKVNADDSSFGKSIQIGKGTTALDKELMIRISGYY